uniref:Uncharacterized protein n=1 Tax=Photinus pyralis TaxID=7054 RepID=A0A1Y1LNL1_PHOPY
MRYQCQLSRQISTKQPTLNIPKTVFPPNIFLEDEISQLKEPEEPIQRPTFKSNLNKDLEMIIAKLKSPSIDESLKITTYTQVYLIICRCFYKIENDIERLKHKMKVNKHTVYPKLKPYNIHHNCETPLQVFLKPPLIENITNKEHKPANATIQDLPAKDCKTRFNLYFNTTQTSAVPLKGKNVPSKPPSKPKSSSQKEVKKLEDSDDDGYPVDEHFDPYAHIVTVPNKHLKSESETVIEEIVDEGTIPPPAVLCQFNFNLYVIIYVYLTEAVESIADLLELRSFKETPYPVIKEIEQPNHTRRLIDLKSLIIQENLENLKAKVILYNYRKASKLNWEKMEMERQLKSTNSDSSMWTVLQSYKGKVEKYNDKPVSYPVNIYEGDIQQMYDKVQHVTEATSTIDAKVDRLLPDHRNTATQKVYSKEDEVDDLEAYIEKVKSETSVHSLYDFKFSKETQKNIDDHASYQEHFYYSLSNSELSEFSIDSEQSDEDTCSEITTNSCCKN